jgi:1,4-dihydroxy-2-naphthoyl-CoA hydrolase
MELNMSIWKTPISVDFVNKMNENTMVDHLGITFTDVGEDTLTATMPVDDRTKQPFGIMHGGASAALAETIGSVAANFCVDPSMHYCVGLDINTSHLRKASQGLVKGVARPIHLGRTTHVWEVKIFDENENLVSQSRLTMIRLDRSQ